MPIRSVPRIDLEHTVRALEADGEEVRFVCPDPADETAMLVVSRSGPVKR